MGLYDSVKEVAGIIQKADNIELYSKILDVQKEAIDLIEENRKLKNKICELEETMNLKKSVRYIEDAYYIEKEDLRYSFPEFLEYNNLCKYIGCLHYKEPNCAVKEAVEKGKINKYRYDFYVRTLEEKMDGRKY